MKAGSSLSGRPDAIARPQSSSLRLCPLCAAEGRAALSQRDSWQLVQCASCRMVFIGNHLDYAAQIEDHDWLDEYPREMDRRRRRHPFLMFLSRFTRGLRAETNSRLLRQTLRWKKEGKLVDFGCGNASFIERASRIFEVTGIEISPRLAELSRRRIPSASILEGPVTEVANSRLAAGSFDVVTQFGYIEHEWQPLEGLRAAARLLRPGGVTVIKTPNFASWNRAVMGTDWCGYHIPAHCNYFTPATLSRMLRSAGLEPLSRPLLDCLPTSDSLWIAARKPG